MASPQPMWEGSSSSVSSSTNPPCEAKEHLGRFEDKIRSYENLTIGSRSSEPMTEEEEHGAKVIATRAKLVSTAARLGINEKGEFHCRKDNRALRNEFNAAKKELKKLHHTSHRLQQKAVDSKRDIRDHNFPAWTVSRRVPMDGSAIWPYFNPGTWPPLLYKYTPEFAKKIQLDNFDPRNLRDHIRDLDETMEDAYRLLKLEYSYGRTY